MVDGAARLRHTFIALAASATMLTLLDACATPGSSGGGTTASPTRAGTATAPAAGASTEAPATAQERALARYSAYAGPPVKSFNWLGRFDSWEPLGKDHLLVYTRPNEAYLLTVSGPCDLRPYTAR